ncbi:MAG: hypothetical protein ACYSW4_08105, partial [Planctomycetota bacterium]
MKAAENNKWLDDALFEALGSEKSEANFEKWRQTHGEVVEMLTSRAGEEPPADKGPFRMGDRIMKSRTIKLTAAAVIMVVALLAIQAPFGPSSVALADVLAKVEQTKAYIYKMNVKVTGPMMPGWPMG